MKQSLPAPALIYFNLCSELAPNECKGLLPKVNKLQNIPNSIKQIPANSNQHNTGYQIIRNPDIISYVHAYDEFNLAVDLST